MAWALGVIPVVVCCLRAHRGCLGGASVRRDALHGWRGCWMRLLVPPWARVAALLLLALLLGLEELQMRLYDSFGL